MVSEKLLRRYVQALPRKRDSLRRGRQRLGEDPLIGRELRFEAHRLAGAAASYGFPDITEAAREVEIADDDTLQDKVDRLLDAIEGAIRCSSIMPRPPQLLLADGDDARRDAWKKSMTGPMQIYDTGDPKRFVELLEIDDLDVVVIGDVVGSETCAELLRRMRQSPRHRTTPVIVASQKPQRENLEHLLEMGIDCYLEVPTEPSLFRAAVDASVRRNAHLQRQARTDGLTAIANRAGYLEQTKRLASLARRNGMSIALALIDLDHFKRVNDTHGHLVGDEVLREFAELLQHTLRGTDVLGRWGGEEFAITLPDTNPAGARIALQKFREILKKRPLSSKKLAVTFSAGVTALDPYAALDQAIDAADELLYAAKSSGRDTILDAVPESPRRWKVALVDHDRDIAELVRDALQPEGFDVLHFHRWNELLHSKMCADLLIVDLQDAEVRLSGRPAPLKVPAMALTSTDEAEVIERAFAAGFDDHVSKPVRPRELIARLRRLID